MKSITVKSPAKINLGLRILKKRDDGFHDIHTLFYPLHDLFDEMIFRKSEKDFITGNFPTELNHNNLVKKAKVYLENFVNKKLSCEIILNKNLPIGAGLGGGSSNAATTLISLNELFNCNVDYQILHKIALDLGSDVPFFLKAKPAIGKSRGEVLEVIDLEIPFPILIVNPRINISTKEIFSKVKPLNNELDFTNIDFSSKHGLNELQRRLTNDFEEIVFNENSEIKSIYESLIEHNALFCRMSGTGSTVYAIFEDEYTARKAKNIFPEKYFLFISKP